MQSRPRWSWADEFDRVSSLLSHLLEKRCRDEAEGIAVPAQLFGVVVGKTAFSLTTIDLDARDPIADLWRLAPPISAGLVASSKWSWVLVFCETTSGDQLGVAVSARGTTLMERRSHGLTTLRSAQSMSGQLVEACASLLGA